MKVFLILFVLALLFVIGSAAAMRYLDINRATRNDNKDDKEGE